MALFKKNRTFIIAEAGVNHNGDLRLARKLVDAAKAAGADAVKFQTFRAEKLASRKAAKASYQKRTTSKKESQQAMLKKLELSEEHCRALMRYARKKRIELFSTPFDEESADMLSKIGVKLFKIPSGEITNTPLLRHIAKKKKPVILSTGMSTLKEVKEAMKVLKKAGARDITLLHCITEYPAPLSELNLRVISAFQKEFGCPVGFSDHSLSKGMPAIAVALGARVIEKHITLSNKMKGPDHKASLEPSSFRRMVKFIRHAEAALGDGIKRPMPCEKKNMAIARKSLVAACDLKKGTKIKAKDIAVKRPGSGILPGAILKVVGKRAKRNIRQDEVLTWEKISG